MKKGSLRLDLYQRRSAHVIVFNNPDDSSARTPLTPIPPIHCPTRQRLRQSGGSDRVGRLPWTHGPFNLPPRSYGDVVRVDMLTCLKIRDGTLPLTSSFRKRRQRVRVLILRSPIPRHICVPEVVWSNRYIEPTSVKSGVTHGRKN